MGFFEIYLLNIDHPDVEASILSEIASGVDVYYDCRWEAAEALSNFLLDEPRWVAHRHILVIGAGLGMETVVIGKLCDKLYVNDLALVALALCSLQLKKNEVKNFEIMHGNYACIP